MALWVRRGMSLGSYDDTRLCPSRPLIRGNSIMHQAATSIAYS